VERGSRPSASDTCFPAPANFRFGEDQVSSASVFVLTLRMSRQRIPLSHFHSTVVILPGATSTSNGPK
jgi:hypothetical protein